MEAAKAAGVPYDPVAAMGEAVGDSAALAEAEPAKRPAAVELHLLRAWVALHGAEHRSDRARLDHRLPGGVGAGAEVAKRPAAFVLHPLQGWLRLHSGDDA